MKVRRPLGRRMLRALPCGITVLVCACAQGPVLGRATDVIITIRKVDDSNHEAECRDFHPTAREVQRFLNSAIIITPMENHNAFYTGPCVAGGTARFRGIEGDWEMNSAGTGRIVFYKEEAYLIADPRQRGSLE